MGQTPLRVYSTVRVSARQFSKLAACPLFQQVQYASPKPMRSYKFTLLAGLLLLGAVFLVAQRAAASHQLPAVPESQPLAAATDCSFQLEEPIEDFPRFARLMHDWQWMPWPSRMGAPDWPRGFHYQWYPETVPLLGNPRGVKAMVPYNVEWLEYLRELQPNDTAAVWLARIAAGLFNLGNEFIPILELDQLTDTPLAAAVSSGGNLVKVLETKNGSGRIEMLFIKNSPPSPKVINYQDTPWLVTKFTSVSDKGELGNAGGIDVYFPNVAAIETGYWVDLKRMEFFPALPYCAKVKNNASVVNTIQGYAKEVLALEAGDAVAIYTYLPVGSNVWGRTDQGWILLQYLSSGGVPIYPTSWSMQTRPPILFP